MREFTMRIRGAENEGKGGAWRWWACWRLLRIGGMREWVLGGHLVRKGPGRVFKACKKRAGDCSLEVDMAIAGARDASTRCCVKTEVCIAFVLHPSSKAALLCLLLDLPPRF